MVLLKKTPQDDKYATYAKKISKDDLLIDFNKKAKDIFNQVRAFSPKPGAFFNIIIGNRRKKIKILKCSIIKEKANAKEIIREGNSSFAIGSSDFFISLITVQVEGKRVMSIEQFLRGAKESITIE